MKTYLTMVLFCQLLNAGEHGLSLKHSKITSITPGLHLSFKKWIHQGRHQKLIKLLFQKSKTGQVLMEKVLQLHIITYCWLELAVALREGEPWDLILKYSDTNGSLHPSHVYRCATPCSWFYVRWGKKKWKMRNSFINCLPSELTWSLIPKNVFS